MAEKNGRKLALSLLLMGAINCSWAQPSGGAAPVRVAVAALETMSATLVVPATVVSRNDARIAAPPVPRTPDEVLLVRLQRVLVIGQNVAVPFPLPPVTTIILQYNIGVISQAPA